MSQPRRRRRRGRRGGQGSASGAQSKQEAIRQSTDASAAPVGDGSERTGRSRRRRGRSRTQPGTRAGSPKSSEDLVRALPKERPATLTAPPDGQTLEAIIGDLQSTWGVPPYPQEYRITVRVAEEREGRAEGAGDAPGPDKTRRDSGESQREARPPRSDQPRREKAPAAPGSASGGPQREKATRKRRRRRRKPGGGGGSSGDGGSNPGFTSEGGSGGASADPT
ncbi:MAG: hypothetical protein M3N53_08275 [Actinomycetota bacterium]|nr:hypothetical protein [Actinomycetota bacterium]